ncbi:MAG TPA: Rieske 2Fe-2S domain-containing protein [Thermoleophilaceae bacterium]|nr:Rieske 2Fe-2S domain-containing protein [Thermoleophilaceae bacterium]
MAADPKTDRGTRRKSPYTADRGLPGAFEGETVTRRGLFTGGALAAGGIATAAIALPSLGFALGPVLRDAAEEEFRDVGSVEDFDTESYVPRVVTDPVSAAAGGTITKTTVYLREATPADEALGQPYIAISTRCTHLGCPVRYVQASERFICPCHGGVYGSLGQVAGGPPVRPLDRFETRVADGRVLVGERFSVNSSFERFAPRDPSNHLDGIWKYLYPPRPTT